MAILLLKKSYRHKDLKEIKFQDLWNSYGVFTTMRVIGKPAKILFFKEHINNLFRSLKIYKINKKNIKKNVLKLIKLNLKLKNKKNLKYKKILNLLKKMDTTKSDIALYKNNKIFETGTSNLLFVKKNTIYSPDKNFYNGTTLKFFKKKIKKIKKANILIDSLNKYDEIIVVGSGKGVVSVSNIIDSSWERKSLKYYRILLKIYQKAVTNCPRYIG